MDDPFPYEMNPNLDRDDEEQEIKIYPRNVSNPASMDVTPLDNYSVDRILENPTSSKMNDIINSPNISKV